MIIVPSTAVETMGLGALGGITAFGQSPVKGATEGRSERATEEGQEEGESS
jgi:hypothetical protein